MSQQTRKAMQRRTVSGNSAIGEYVVLQAEKARYTIAPRVREVKEHIITTFHLFSVALLANVAIMVIYNIAARGLCYDAATDSTSNGIYALRYLAFGLMAVVTTWYYLVVIRGVMVAAPIIFGEPLLIGFLEIAGKLVSFVMPDLVENFLNESGEYSKLMEKAKQSKVFANGAKTVMTTMTSIFAWALAISVFFIEMPLYKSLPSFALYFVGVSALIAMVYGWGSTPPFWLKKIQSFGMYYVVTVVLWEVIFSVYPRVLDNQTPVAIAMYKLAIALLITIFVEAAKSQSKDSTLVEAKS